MKKLTKPLMKPLTRQILSGKIIFSPLDLNPLFYFNGEDTTSLPTTSPIENVFDLSSNNNDIGQTVEDSKPLLVSESGYRAISFDAVDDFLFRNDSLGLMGNTGLTIMLVLKLKTGNINAVPVLRVGASDPLTVTYNIGSRFRVFANSIAEFFTTLGQSGDIQILTITKPSGGDNTSTRLFLNDTEIPNTSTSGNSINLINDYLEFSFGTQQSSGPSFLYSAFIKGEEISSRGRIALNSYFKNQYNII